MLTTHHGWWPFFSQEGLALAVPPLPYFRHSRLSLVNEGVNGEDVHIITVALVTTGTQTPGGAWAGFSTRAYIVAEGAKTLEEALAAPVVDNPKLEINLESFEDMRAIFAVPLSSNAVLAARGGVDRRHDTILALLHEPIEKGGIRTPPPDPTPEQSAYAW